jgi:transposase-like protein
MYIFAGIMSLLQYNTCCDYKAVRPDYCPGCHRANPWCHGYYPRKPDRLNPADESLNPVWIPRYYCPGCKKTFSALPECIPPRRWYLWESQQEAIVLFLLLNSARHVEQQIKPSRQTIKRWISWLLVQFKAHKDALCTWFPSLGLFTEPAGFWKHVFDKLPLSTAMRLCHVSGVSIP